MRGLGLMTAALSAWNYGRDPVEPMRFEGALAALRRRLGAGEPVFEVPAAVSACFLMCFLRVCFKAAKAMWTRGCGLTS